MLDAMLRDERLDAISMILIFPAKDDANIYWRRGGTMIIDTCFTYASAAHMHDDFDTT